MTEENPYAAPDASEGAATDKKASAEAEKAPRSASDSGDGPEAHRSSRSRRKGHESPPK